MWFLDDYALGKLDFTTWATMSDGQAHFSIGLALYLLVLVGTARPFAALTLVALAEGINELLDRLHYGSWRWPNTREDLIATLAVPVMLTVILWLVQSALARRKALSRLRERVG